MCLILFGLSIGVAIIYQATREKPVIVESLNYASWIDESSHSCIVGMYFVPGPNNTQIMNYIWGNQKVVRRITPTKFKYLSKPDEIFIKDRIETLSLGPCY